jgi:hypothetical protein
MVLVREDVNRSDRRPRITVTPKGRILSVPAYLQKRAQIITTAIDGRNMPQESVETNNSSAGAFSEKYGFVLQVST